MCPSNMERRSGSNDERSNIPVTIRGMLPRSQYTQPVFQRTISEHHVFSSPSSYSLQQRHRKAASNLLPTLHCIFARSNPRSVRRSASAAAARAEMTLSPPRGARARCTAGSPRARHRARSSSPCTRGVVGSARNQDEGLVWIHVFLMPH